MGQGLWGDALVITLMGLQFGLLDNHESPGTPSTVLELMCKGDTLDKEAIMCFKPLHFLAVCTVYLLITRHGVKIMVLKGFR